MKKEKALYWLVAALLNQPFLISAAELCEQSTTINVEDFQKIINKVQVQGCTHKKINDKTLNETKEKLLAWDNLQGEKSSIPLKTEFDGRNFKYNLYSDLGFFDIQRNIPIDGSTTRKRIDQVNEDQGDNNDSKVVTSLLSWFQNGDKGIDKEILAQQIAKKREEFLLRHRCLDDKVAIGHSEVVPDASARIKVTSDEMNLINRLDEKTVGDYPKIMTTYLSEKANEKKDFEEKINNLNKRFSGSEAVNNLISCDNSVPDVSQSEFKYGEIEIIQPCVGEVSMYFSDNSAKLDINKLIKSGEIDTLKECIESRIKDGAALDSFNIASSSSSLDNNPKEGEGYGRKEFLKLSQARADAAKNLILPKLVTDKNILNRLPVTIDPYGKNGDGTSGPCPYAINEADGKQYLQPGYEQGGQKRKELESDKFVRINVSFSRTKKDMKTVKEVQLAKKCRTIFFTCMKNASGDFNGFEIFDSP